MSLDAYDLARLDGFEGTKPEFYQQKYLAEGFNAVKSLGFEGTEDELQAQFIVKDAPLNAYDLAVSFGFKGSAKDWLGSLNGMDGADAFEVAQKSGFVGTRDEWLHSLKGMDGLDAYQLALSLGFEGTLAEFLESLKGEKGDRGDQGEKGDKGDPGRDGQDGAQGETGPMPDHQWRGTAVRFEKPDGTWGQWVELRGLRGPDGQLIVQPGGGAGGAGSLSIQRFYDSVDDFPTPGKTQILYFDKSTDPYGVYIWDGNQYQQVGGGEGAASDKAYTVAIKVKNQTGSTILKGTPIMAVGTLGMSGQILVAPMDGTNPENYKYLVGLAAADIPNGGDGEAVDFGKIRLLDTSAFNEGDVLWISTTTVGALTNVEPSNGLKMPVAFVVASAVNTGTLMVRITPINEAAFVEHSFETVAKNLKAKDATLSYTNGDLTEITYSNGVTKTLQYTAGELTTITLSGSTPLGIDLVKTLGYTSGNLTSVSYSTGVI
jgi:hypothetical protein